MNLRKATQLTLGIVTGVGGFFDIGNLATSAQAGASFRFQLLWSLALGTILVIFLVEMSGRFAAVTRKALPDAIREHFGFKFWLVPFVVLTLLHLLVLASEIGGICFALHLVTGLPPAVWALPVAALIWLFLWRSTFGTIENSTSLLGLLTLAFVVAAVHHHPPTHEMLAGMLPSLPHHDPAK
jgi:NRAMP (natural resistance-associated macrophage protein)-like metal ion transporter